MKMVCMIMKNKPRLFLYVFLCCFAVFIGGLGVGIEVTSKSIYNWEIAKITVPKKHIKEKAEFIEVGKTGDASHYMFTLCEKLDGSYIGRNWGCNTNEIVYDYSYGDDEIFCAARDFPRYSWITVTNQINYKSVTCQILDFGPSQDEFPERIVDLSRAAFAEIANPALGVVPVVVYSTNKPGNL